LVTSQAEPFAHFFRFVFDAADLDFQSADVASAEVSRELSQIEWMDLLHLETGERRIGHRRRAGEICDAGGYCTQIVFGGDCAGEVRRQDSRIRLTHKAVDLRCQGHRLVGSSGYGSRHASVGGEHRCAALARRLGQLAVPGHKLAALAVAADPFQFTAGAPIFWYVSARREFDRGVWIGGEQAFDCVAVGIAPGERRRAVAGGAPVRVDMPGSEDASVDVSDFGGLYGSAPAGVGGGEDGGPPVQPRGGELRLAR